MAEESVTTPSGYALVTLSGGYDSAAALYLALDKGPAQALFVRYGQRYAEQEADAVSRVHALASSHANYLGLESIDTTLGRWAGDARWIPYRNVVIAALATNYAISTTLPRGHQALRCTTIVFGSKSVHYRPHDPVSFLDSTVDFYDELHGLLARNTEPHHPAPPEFVLPCAGWTKREVMLCLQSHGVRLSSLWNCYREDGATVPCGWCEHCVGTLPLVRELEA